MKTISKTRSKTKPKTASGSQPKSTLIVFLLDRSGSMSSCKTEAISGFNAYVGGIKAVDGMRFTFVQFDTMGIDTIHEAVAIGKVAKLSGETFLPRAETPLYDAVGKTITATMAKAGKSKVLFVTLTDGHENSSTEWNETTVKQLIKEREDKDHWTFAHIGVGAGGWAAAHHMAQGTQSAQNVLRTTGRNVSRSLARAGGQSVAYACSVGTDNMVAKAFFGGQTDDTKKSKSKQPKC